MKRIVLIVPLLILIVVAFSGCTSNSTTKFTTTSMTFTVPSDWTNMTFSNDSVKFENPSGDDSFWVMTVSKEDYNSIGTNDPVALDGYSYVGNFTDDSANPYRMYHDAGNTSIGYTFVKNNKYFVEWGTADNEMQTVIKTIN
jgi:hypothetical protein